MKRQLSIGLLLFFCVAVCQAGSPRDYRRKQADQWYQCVQTLLDMRALQTAIEAYGIDHPTYPIAKSMEELRALVQPTYISKTPMKDAWGTPFRYVVSQDGKSYKLVSAGSDRAFAEESWKLPSFLSDSEADAVLTSEGWGSYREWVIQE